MKVARIVVLGVAVSRQRGTLSLALRSLADSLPNAPRAAEEDEVRRSNSVNFVRYGITSIQSAK